MTQEDKLLLIQDLSARLPYAVTVEHTSGFRGTLHDLAIHHMYDDNDNVYDAICYTDFFGDEDHIHIEYFKPCLFPLSSMTEAQKRNLTSLFNCHVEITQYEIKFADYQDSNMDNWNKVFNWCYKNHFDINSLIPMNLAIDATNKNIY